MSFNKRGGFLAEVDNAIFLEAKGSKRVLHFRSTKVPARTLEESLPDSTTVDGFNLQDHIELLSGASSAVEEFSI